MDHLLVMVTQLQSSIVSDEGLLPRDIKLSQYACTNDDLSVGY